LLFALVKHQNLRMRAFARFKESNHGLQPSCDTGDAGVAFFTEIGERNGSCSYVLHVPFMYLVLCRVCWNSVIPAAAAAVVVLKNLCPESLIRLLHGTGISEGCCQCLHQLHQR